MGSTLTLKRTGTAPFTSAPRATRAGDYICTSSIYPIDEDGNVIGGEAPGRLSAPAQIEVQARACLDALAAVLKEAGSSMGKVLKVDVHLVDAADFYEFKRVWREYFPDNPPARTVVEIGDTLPFRGALLNLDATALAESSPLERQVLHDPEGEEALDVEGASHAIRAGNFVFCSGFTASDFKTGLAVGKRPGFPNYGNDAEMQAKYVFDRMNRVLAQAGTSLAETVESQLYEPDLSTFHAIDTVWRSYMPIPPCRSSMGVKSVLVPGAAFVPNFTVLVPDDKHRKEESFEGISWHPTKARGVNFSPTLKVGDWRFFAGQIPTPDFQTVHRSPPGLPFHFSDIEVQTRFTIDMLTRQLEANDTDWEHCYQARVYLVEPQRDYRSFLRVWTEYFPDPAKAPVLAFVPSSGIMFPGPLIEIDPNCIAKA